MSKLFKRKPEHAVKSVRYQLRLTTKDDEKIRHSANIRQMDVSEFVRCAALGRKADVDFDTEIVLALSACVRAVRDLHAAMVERDIDPPDDLLRPVITEAVAAMHRIEGKGINQYVTE